MKSIKEKLSAVRKRMKKENIQAYIIPTNGPHKSEYVADHWAHREWISGFTGSAATVVVTNNKAGLWTDARYYQQADEQLNDTEIKVFKSGLENVPDPLTWLSTELSAGERVGAAAWTTMMSNSVTYRKKLKESNIKFATTADLVGDVWSKRPNLSDQKIFEHDVSFAGLSRKEKLKLFRRKMKQLKADATLVSALDEIGWILNLRGSDVDFNPVFYAYLWIEKKKCVLFVDTKKVDIALQTDLAKNNIQVLDYNLVFKKLRKLSKGKRVALDAQGTNSQLYNRIKAKEVVHVDSPIKHLKAIKNDTEIRHLKQAMVKDGVALTQAFRWLDITLSAREVSEYEFGIKLAECRADKNIILGRVFQPLLGMNQMERLFIIEPMNQLVNG